MNTEPEKPARMSTRKLNPLRSSGISQGNVWMNTCKGRSQLDVSLLRHSVGVELINDIESVRASIDLFNQESRRADNTSSGQQIDTNRMAMGEGAVQPLNTVETNQLRCTFLASSLANINRSNLQQELINLNNQYERLVDSPRNSLSQVDSLRQISTGLKHRLNTLIILKPVRIEVDTALKDTRSVNLSEIILNRMPTSESLVDTSEDSAWDDIFSTLDLLSTPLKFTSCQPLTLAAQSEPHAKTMNHKTSRQADSAIQRPLHRSLPRLAPLKGTKRQDPFDSMTVTINLDSSRTNRPKLHS